MGLTSSNNTSGVVRTIFLFTLIILSVSSPAISAASYDDKSTMDALLSAVTPTPSRWSSTAHYCNWRGVKCDAKNRVFSLTLPSQSLSGTLPPSLNSLTHLTILSIQNNHFTGPLPSFSNLSRLRKLHLDNNSFTSVPRGTFSGLINLEILSLSDNNKLSGWHFPSELSSSPKMVALQASNANMVGSIPDIFSSFPHLVNLTLSNNNLSGTLPGSFNGSAIKNLKLDKQKLGLTGNIDLLSGMSNLSVVWINGNKFSGVISPSFISLRNLSDIKLEDNNFIGPIPHLSKNVVLYLDTITPNNSHRNLGALTSSSGKKRNVGAIVGLTFLLVLAVLAFFLWICWKRRSPQQQPQPQPQQQPRPQPQPQHQPQHQPQPRPQPQPQPQPQQRPQPQPQPHSQPQPQPVPQQRPQPQPRPRPQAQAQAQHIPQAQGQPRPRPQQQPQPQQIPQAQPRPRPQPQPQQRPQPQPQQRPQPQPQPRPPPQQQQQQQRPQAQAQQRPQPQVEENSLGLPNKYTYEYLMSITGDFHQRNKIGGGDFGLVYKGNLSDGTMVAVKCLNFRGVIKDFKNEVDALGRAHHANLVTLLGYCAEGVYRILVYEYMSNDSLDNWIFHEKQRRSLTWPVMKNIILGIAQGLVHLHDNCDKKIMHRDLMPSNVLLDGAMNAKLCDFGMAKLIDKDQTSTMTAFARSHRYMAPEMKQGKKITEKVDVYSFGMVVLEILFGKRYFKLVELGEKDVEVDNLPVLIRKNLSVEMRKNANEIEKIGRLAVSCMCENPRERPSMAIVLAQILDPEANF